MSSSILQELIKFKTVIEGKFLIEKSTSTAFNFKNNSFREGSPSTLNFTDSLLYLAFTGPIADNKRNLLECYSCKQLELKLKLT